MVGVEQAVSAPDTHHRGLNPVMSPLPVLVDRHPTVSCFSVSKSDHRQIEEESRWRLLLCVRENGLTDWRRLLLKRIQER